MGKLKKFIQDWKNQKTYAGWLWQYTKPFMPQIGIILLCSLLTSVAAIGTAVLSKTIIDSAISGGFLKKAIIIYIILIFVSQFIDIISQLLSVMLDEKYSFGVRKQVYEKIINSHWMDVKRYHSGDLLTRLTSDAGNIANGIIYTIPMIIRLTIEMVLTFCTLFYYEPRLAIFAAVLGPVAACCSFWLGRKLKALTVKVQETEAEYRSYMQESIENLLIVKSFSNEEYATNRLVELRDNRFKWVWKKTKFSVLVSSSMSFTFSIGYLVAFTFGAIQVSVKAITYGTMSIFLTLVNRIQAPVLGLSQQVPKIVSILASAGRVMELENIPEEEKHPVEMEVKNIGVNLKDVSFGYSDENVLEECNMDIKPGEFVALIGESGVGKTTLVRLMMSFMSNVQGDIVFRNGAGERVPANAGTREFMSYVPQGNTLFSGTIRENIKMGKLDATEEEIIEALKIASAFDFVMDLPQGIDTVIGERGHGISEGQAQRIAIARAVIKKAPFLILDEATSSLDEKTELAVLRGIQGLSPHPTCLIITHRRSVLSYCDREIKISDKHTLC